MRAFYTFAAVYAALCLSAPIQAETRKTTSPYDYRVKNVVFHDNDTVEIDGVIGLATHIVIAPDETYLTHVFGDANAWSFAHKDNHFFVKPKQANGDTDLVIVTNKHSYNLLLHYVGSSVGDTFIKTPWAIREATIQVNYLYPDEVRHKKNSEAEKYRVSAELADPFSIGPKNLAYRMSDDPKSRSIAPIAVWDDYHFTYFKFPTNAELPTLFALNSSGKENVVNATVMGVNHNILAAHITSREWFIRFGDRVVGVVNDAFNPNYGANNNGTISSAVRRVEIGEDDE